jgi:hypothetical protein
MKLATLTVLAAALATVSAQGYQGNDYGQPSSSSSMASSSGGAYPSSSSSAASPESSSSASPSSSSSAAAPSTSSLPPAYYTALSSSSSMAAPSTSSPADTSTSTPPQAYYAGDKADTSADKSAYIPAYGNTPAGSRSANANPNAKVKYAANGTAIYNNAGYKSTSSAVFIVAAAGGVAALFL